MIKQNNFLQIHPYFITSTKNARGERHHHHADKKEMHVESDTNMKFLPFQTKKKGLK